MWRERLRHGAPLELRAPGAAGRRPVIPRPKYALAELLRKVNARHAHGEVSTGEPVGREAW